MCYIYARGTQISFGFGCNLSFEELVKMACEKSIGIIKEDIKATSTENNTSVKIGYKHFLHFSRFLDAILDKLSTTLTSFTILDGNGMEDDMFRRKLADPYKKKQFFETFYEQLKKGREKYFCN